MSNKRRPAFENAAHSASMEGIDLALVAIPELQAVTAGKRPSRRRRTRFAEAIDQESITKDNRTKSQKAFEYATLDLALSGIQIDAEQVPPLVAYRDGTMNYAEACEAMRKRHAEEDTANSTR